MVVGAAGGGRPAKAAWHVPRYSPPVADLGMEDAVQGAGDGALAGLALAFLNAMLAAPLDGGNGTTAIEQAIDPEVVVWSPTVYATTREEAVAAIRGPDDEDDTLTEVQLTIEATDVVGTRVYLQWRLTGRFTNPCFVDDDLLVEPTGRLVEASGVQVATFRDGRLVRVHCYYDDLALLEQLVSG